MLKKEKRFFLYIIGTVYIFGCGLILPPLNPITDEDRNVSIATNQEQKVIFKNAMVWYDNHRRNEGILFPKGTYILEAEDTEYFYFTAPSDLEFRSFKNGQTINVQFVSGGLFLSKAWMNMVPAGAYRSDGNTKKTFLWKLGSNFMRMEGEGWETLY